jgi:prevent-host-death family protein
MDQIVPGVPFMKSVGSSEAKTHLPRLLSQVQKGETITITKRGKPIARIVPAQEQPARDVASVIREFKAYSKKQARTRGKLSGREIKGWQAVRAGDRKP